MQNIFSELNENRDKVNGQFEKQLFELNQKVERLKERFVNEEVKADLYEKFSAKFKRNTVRLSKKWEAVRLLPRTLIIT